MIEMKGVGVSPGIAVGKAFVSGRNKTGSVRKTITSAEEEIKRLHTAVDKTIRRFPKLCDWTKEFIGDFIDKTENEIKTNRINAEWAAENARDYYMSMFMSLGCNYMRERAADIKEFADRILICLKNENVRISSETDEKIIVVVKELTPSDIAKMDRERVSGIITETGDGISDSAIIARALGIPVIAGSGITRKIRSGDLIVFDCRDECIYIKPTEEILHQYSAEKNFHQGPKSSHIRLTADISSPEGIKTADENGADGIGLFRTEFLYMGRKAPPTEEEQFSAYKSAAESNGGKPVIIKTLDIGGDRQIGWLELPKEDNPLLGCRGIRLCLNHKDLFRTQLRAILRAGAYGDISIMFPMITDIEEIREAKLILGQAKEQLQSENIPFPEAIKTGIMIETPAAALMSDVLAKEANFFNIGTDALLQYSMACDRLSASAARLYSFCQPAFLRLLRIIIENAHREGILVGICGEAAWSKKLVPLFAGMGIDELILDAGAIPGIREAIGNTSREDKKRFVENILSLSSAGEVELTLEGF